MPIDPGTRSRDGQRLVAFRPADSDAGATLTLVSGWTQLLAERP